MRDKLTKEGELPIAEAVRILRDLVDALCEAHAHGVVQRVGLSWEDDAELLAAWHAG